MNTRHSDLIAIANADLARKLTNGQKKNGKKSVAESRRTTGEKDNGRAKVSFIDADARIDAPEATAIPKDTSRNNFSQDVWRAVFALNLFRYGLGLLLLVSITANTIDSSWRLFATLPHPKLFFFATLVLLASAIIFSYLSKRRELDFNHLITAQLSLDVILAGLLTHASGSVDSTMVLLYLVVVTTGSVVLPRKFALALASGAVIVLFAEHFYSIFSSHDAVNPNYGLLATYGIVLMALSLLVAYLAEKIRVAELKSYVPGAESIEDFLVREEVNALKAALDSTQGNKTEAAKLLGMSFRSFRYKLTKYDIH